MHRFLYDPTASNRNQLLVLGIPTHEASQRAPFAEIEVYSPPRQSFADLNNRFEENGSE